MKKILIACLIWTVLSATAMAAEKPNTQICAIVGETATLLASMTQVNRSTIIVHEGHTAEVACTIDPKSIDCKNKAMEFRWDTRIDELLLIDATPAQIQQICLAGRF